MERAGFNPLHCGAVVASGELKAAADEAARVSIPFIAGQWSLLQTIRDQFAESYKFQSPSLRGSGRFATERIRGCIVSAVFQSPSLRGSGRFRSSPPPWSAANPCFNPLHCGAVVASIRRATRSEGSWKRFNPLHCGAVVASSDTAVEPSGSSRFNPLHCGAVVASAAMLAVWRAQREVSIPFIAGQWSLQRRKHEQHYCRNSVSIPFIAGQWSLLARRAPQLGMGFQVSIPFIAGQWSLPAGSGP